MAYKKLHQKLVILSMLLCLAIPGHVSAENSDWKLYVILFDEGNQAIADTYRSYKLAWIKQDKSKQKLHRQLMDLRKLEPAKTGLRNAFTHSNNFVIVVEFDKMGRMWKGPRQKTTSLSIRKGKTVELAKKRIREATFEYEWTATRFIEIIDMKAAKKTLNQQYSNPFYGNPITEQQSRKSL